MKEKKKAGFRAFYWCKQCHEDIRDPTLIKKCKCKNRECLESLGVLAVALFRRSTKAAVASKREGECRGAEDDVAVLAERRVSKLKATARFRAAAESRRRS